MFELYQAEEGPCSEKMTELGLSSTIHTPRRHGGEVQNERTHGELLALGREDQIPLLVDHRNEKEPYRATRSPTTSSNNAGKR